ncbi:MAG: HDOD domain-containing protein [Lentisphaerae bacterium]|nr:HDOD domain-containing protein [Lentisphaerota bacterium]
MNFGSNQRDLRRPTSRVSFNVSGRLSSRKPVQPEKPVLDVSHPIVLVADANPEDAELIRTIAANEGCEVHLWGQVKGLINRIREVKPFVLFLDKDMKDVELFSLSKQIRQQNVALVLQGQFTVQNDIIMAARMGVGNILIRPLAQETVAPKIVQALAQAKETFKRAVEFKPAVNEFSHLSIAQRLNYLMEQTKEVQSLPQTTSRIMQLCNLQTSNAEEIAKAAKLDPAISAMLLKRASSVMYGANAPITSVRDAVVRMGHRTVRSMVMLMSTYKLTEGREKSFVFNRLGAWIHGLAVGVIAEELARRARIRNAEDDFLAGVLHDFGKLICDDHLHEQYMNVIRMAQEARVPLRDMELQSLGLSHEQIGYHVFCRWKLPPPICEAIAHHHDRELLSKPEPTQEEQMAGFVQAADQIAKALLIGDSGDGYAMPMGGGAWDRFGLPLSEAREFVRNAIGKVEEFTAWLNIPPDRTGLIRPAPMTQQWVGLLEEGEPDRLLELFLLHMGFQVFHVRDQAKLEGMPAAVIYDFRQGTPSAEGLDPRWFSPAVRHIALTERTAEKPSFIPKAAVMLAGNLDYMDLLQHVRDIHP